MTYKVKTIQELELLHYGTTLNFLGKSDALITTSTSGVFNTVFGALAWANLNLEANPFSILPKYVYDKSGFRIITAKATPTAANGTTAKGGTPESGNLGEAVKPTLETVSVKPKIAQLPFGASTVQEWIANNTKDDVWGSLSSLRTFMAGQHKELLSQMIVADVEATVTGSDYTGTNDWETLDRIISSKAEATALDSGNHKWYNYMSLDKVTQTKYDATVDSAGSTAFTTNGNLTNSLILTHLRKLRKSSGRDPTVALGSHEVYSELQEIFTPATRYNLGESMVSIDVNGISTFTGEQVGLHVATVYGIPFIPTKDAPSDSTDAPEVGRMLFLDTSDSDGFGQPRLGIQIAVPTTYNESTRNTLGYPYINAGFTEKGLYWTMGELIGRRFNSNGKIRDIQL